MSFTADLKFGQIFQELTKKLVGEKVIHSPDGNFKPYDFKTEWVEDEKTGNTTYEVKADRLGHKWGSFYIEFECNGKPSGLSTTEADYWWYYIVKDNYYMAWEIPTKTLRDSISTAKCVKSGGDGGRSKGYIFNWNNFENFKQTEKYVNYSSS